jgi:hypothetical protein
MNLTETIKELDTAKAASLRDPDLEPPFTRGAVEGSVNAAKNDIVRLRKEVKLLTNATAGGIFLLKSTPEGRAQEDFIIIAEDEGGAVTVDGGELYQVLTDAVERVMANNNSREWRIDITHALMAQLSGLGQRLGISYMAGLDTSKYIRSTLPTRDDVLAMVRDIVRKAVGDDLNGLKLQQDIADAVIKAEHVQNVVPVVVINTFPEDIPTLGNYVFGTRFVTATTKETTEKSDVIAVFKHLKPLLKRPNP